MDDGLGCLVTEIVALAALAAGGWFMYSTANTIPSANKVQQGYIAPSKLEVQCTDLDGNGEPETVLKIGGVPYLLREVDGKPVLSLYEITPLETRALQAEAPLEK